MWLLILILILAYIIIARVIFKLEYEEAILKHPSTFYDYGDEVIASIFWPAYLILKALVIVLKHSFKFIFKIGDQLYDMYLRKRNP